MRLLKPRKMENKLINHSLLKVNKFAEGGRNDSNLGCLNTCI